MPANDLLWCPFITPSGSTRRKPRGRMYGLLFESVQMYIKQDYGEDVWAAVLDQAGLPQVVFQLHKTYPDEMMLNLAKAAAQVLGNQVNDVMFYFGTCFVSFFTKFNYDQILRLAGRHYRDFLNEIDNVHETMRFSYPKMQSPSFIVQSEDRNGCILIYRSMRTGFTYYVIGQLVQCAKVFFDVSVDIVVLEEISSEEGCHVTFRLTFDNTGYVPPNGKGSMMNLDLASYPEIKSSTFFKIFPFCVVFNSQMRIIGCGSSLTSLLKSENLLGRTVTDLVSLRRPLVDFTWNNIMCLQRVIFELEWRNGPTGTDKSSGFGGGRGGKNGKRRLLRGQMKYIQDWDAMAFLCTPLLGDLDDMLQAGVYLHDLNMFDNSRDLVMTGTQYASDLEYSMEKQTAWSKQIEHTLSRLDKAREQSEKLINSMLTKSIADRLKKGDDPLTTCEAFPKVTILFSYLVRFSDICTDGTPMQVVECIQNVTEVYDKIVDKYSLFKVETLGDGVYMVAGGVPDKCHDHAEKVAGLALELVENAIHVKNPVTGNGMQIRIGMHTGSVVAGIVGKRTPQYCLFGDTVNTAARMQTNSEPGRIHLTEPCHECLRVTDFISVYRGRINVKGKGEMKTYWLAGRRGDESTTAMCRTIREEHRLHRQRSSECPVDHHAMHNSSSASNFMAMADVTEQDEKEFRETLSTVFDDEVFSEEDQPGVKMNTSISEVSSRHTSRPAPERSTIVKTHVSSNCASPTISATPSKGTMANSSYASTSDATPTRHVKSLSKSNGTTPSVSHQSNKTLNGSIEHRTGCSPGQKSVSRGRSIGTSSPRKQPGGHGTSRIVKQGHGVLKPSSSLPPSLSSSSSAAAVAEAATMTTSTPGVVSAHAGRSHSTRKKAQERRKRLSESPHS